MNHFRNYYELTRKDLLVKNLKRRKKQLEKEERWEEAAKYDLSPTTFVLPAEYGLFVEEFKRCGMARPGQLPWRVVRSTIFVPFVCSGAGGVWIMKPIGKAQGKGIFLFNKLSQISDWRKDHRWSTIRAQDPPVENYIVQRYIERPYLIGKNGRM